MNADHQFSLTVDVIIDGKHYGKKKAKTFWFNSVGCAELFLMQHGYCRSGAVIGSGERLREYCNRGEAQGEETSRTKVKRLLWGNYKTEFPLESVS